MNKSCGGKGKELEFPEGRGGGKGAKNGPGVPLRLIVLIQETMLL